MNLNNKILSGLIILVLSTGNVLAEKKFVTDKILLGIHSEATENSPLIKSVPSGTEMEVMATSGDFARVRLRDGTEGWVSQAYLTDKPSAVQQLNQLSIENGKLKEDLEKLKTDVFKKEKEVQLHRDELSNARTTIRELKKQNSTGTAKPDAETEQKLQQAEQEIAGLKQRIKELETAPAPEAAPAEEKAKPADNTGVEELQKQVTELKARVDMASAYLSGNRVPSEEELDAAYPSLPSWFWGVIFLVLIAGALGGIFMMDYRMRKRHGGFRL